MMTVPFDVNDGKLRALFLRQLLFNALVPLRAESRPAWGKMTAQQMVEHLTWAFELSTGLAHAECPVPEAQRERLKAFLYENRPTPHEFMNPVLTAGLPPPRHKSLADAVASLRAAADHFARKTASTPDATYIHPVFGPIGLDEWARTHFKHAYHHLVQFGLIEAEL